MVCGNALYEFVSQRLNHTQFVSQRLNHTQMLFPLIFNCKWKCLKWKVALKVISQTVHEFINQKSKIKNDCAAYMWNVMIQPNQNFAHTRTAKVPWHVQNYELIGLLKFKLYEIEMSKAFNHMLINCFWSGFLITLYPCHHSCVAARTNFPPSSHNSCFTHQKKTTKHMDEFSWKLITHYWSSGQRNFWSKCFTKQGIRSESKSLHKYYICNQLHRVLNDWWKQDISDVIPCQCQAFKHMEIIKSVTIVH